MGLFLVEFPARCLHSLKAFFIDLLQSEVAEQDSRQFDTIL